MKKKAYARLIVLRLFREACQAARRIEHNPSARRIHDGHVAIRRLRTVIQALGPLLQSDEYLSTRKRLRPVAHALGRARDPYVLCKKLKALRLSSAASTTLARQLARELKADEKKAEHLAQRSMRRFPSFKNIGATMPLDRRSVSSGKYERWTSRHLLKKRKRLMKLLTNVGAADSPHLHRARIELKKFRYLLETLDDERKGKALRAMKEAQTALGEIHDYALLERFVRSATRRRRIKNKEILIGDICNAIRSQRDGVYVMKNQLWRNLFD